MKKTYVICIMNNKGGVGKTTIALNLGLAFSQKYQTLLIDMDPQSNLTTSFENINLKTCMSDIITNKCNILDSINKITETLHIIPSSKKLNIIENELIKKINNHLILSEKLNSIKSLYDYIIIDNPPAVGVFTKNSVCTSTHILVPIIPEPYAVSGLKGVSEMFMEFKKNIKFQMLGIVINNFDQRKKLHIAISQQLQNNEKLDCFQTKIRTNSMFSLTQSKKSKGDLQKIGKGFLDFLQLQSEIIGRIHGKK